MATSNGRTVSIDWDDTELKQLAVDLTEAPGRMQRAAPKAIKRGAEIIEAAMKQDARGHRYLPHFPTAVTHSILSRWEAEIGFSKIKGTQGALAHIILLGSINNAPVYDFTAAPRRVTPLVEEVFAGTAEDVTLGVKDA